MPRSSPEATTRIPIDGSVFPMYQSVTLVLFSSQKPSQPLLADHLDRIQAMGLPHIIEVLNTKGTPSGGDIRDRCHDRSRRRLHAPLSHHDGIQVNTVRTILLAPPAVGTDPCSPCLTLCHIRANGGAIHLHAQTHVKTDPTLLANFRR